MPAAVPRHDAPLSMRRWAGAATSWRRRIEPSQPPIAARTQHTPSTTLAPLVTVAVAVHPQRTEQQKRLRVQALQLQQQPHKPLLLIGKGRTLLGELDAHPNGRGSTLLKAVAARLADVGWVALRLGAPAGSLDAVAAEALDAYPRMRPGKVVDPLTGAVRSGVDPTGTARGDRFSHVHDETVLGGGSVAWPALHALDAQMERVAIAIAGAVANEPRLPFDVQGRSDSMIACFPGGGAEYGAHLDSNLHGGSQEGLDPRKLTCIAYPNADWDEAAGGALCIHDRERGCWWRHVPHADTLVVFRSDRVLHRVSPAYRWRLALTVFLTGEYTAAQPSSAHLEARRRRTDLE